MNNNKINYLLAITMIKAYSDLGVKYAFVSPGSRNTPLMLALSDQKKIKVYNIFDERNSGYLALGASKFLQSPNLIITTSGTAVSNLFSSIIEGYMSNTPLIILTADRPKSLQGTGANQTIDQHSIFKGYVNTFTDISNIKNKDIYNFVSKTYYESMGYYGFKKGPIHINIPFKAPLHLTSRNEINIYNKKYKFEEEIKKNNKITLNLKKYLRPIIICTNKKDLNIIYFAEKYNIPIFMECLGLRFKKKSKTIISSYDFILDNYNINPDLIIRFGSKPISNSLNNFIDINKDLVYLVTDKKFNDDAKNIINFNSLLNQFIDDKIMYNNNWIDSLISKQNTIKTYLDTIFSKPIHHEGYIINKIISILPKNSNLIIGNSSPIRDLDKFTFNTSSNINIFANRGASGIDGLISTSLGVSLNSKNNNFLILGDISFFYDMSSLAINIPCNLTIIIINNNGGHIFDRLEGLSDEKQYSKYWLTPQDIDIKNIAMTFKCSYTQIDYDKILLNKSKFFLNKGINLFEINIDSKKHHLNNKELENNIKSLLA